MGPKERHLHKYQKNEDAEMNQVVQAILASGSIGHNPKRKTRRRMESNSRTRNQGGTPTTKR